VTCRLVYEPKLAWGFPAAGLLAALICGIVALRTRTGRRRPWALFSGFWLIWSIAGALLVPPEYARRRAVADSPATPSVEGVVRNFHPVGLLHWEPESFTVDGVWFAYSENEATGGFNQTRGIGGPIRGGEYVRIRYEPGTGALTHNVIMRLEVCR